MSGTKPVETVWETPTGKTISVLTKLSTELGFRGAEVIDRLNTDVSFRHQVVEFLIGRHSCVHHPSVDLHISD